MRLAYSVLIGATTLLCATGAISAQEAAVGIDPGYAINMGSMQPGGVVCGPVEAVGDGFGPACDACGPACTVCGPTCDSCGPACGAALQCCPSPYRISGGAEVVWIEPHLNNGAAFIEYDTVDEGVAIDDFDNIDDMTFRSVEFDKGTAIRAWLGIENCQRLGSRVRYFYFNQDANPRSAMVGADLVDAVARDIGVAEATALAEGATLSVTSSLEMQALDLEVTKTIQLCPVQLTFSGGLRWARTDSLLRVQTDNTAQDLDAGYQVDAVFDGYGPTFAMDVRHPLYGGCLAMVGGVRTSAMFGNSDVTVVGINNPDTTQVGRDSGLFIAELTIGMEYRTRFCCGPELLIRAAWEGQYWSGMPLATRMGDNFSDADSMFVEGIGLTAGLTF